MEIVLLEDVKALGKKGQVVKVNDGYARNFILPKKLGVEATAKNLNDLKLQKANDAKVAAEQLAAAKELGEKIEKSKGIQSTSIFSKNNDKTTTDSYSTNAPEQGHSATSSNRIKITNPDGNGN